MKWTVRSKFLLVMSSLLFVCLGFYLLMSISVFKTDKTQLVFDLNRSQVSNIAGEIESLLTGLSETLSLYAQLPEENQKQLIQSLFSGEGDIVALGVYKGDLSSGLDSHHYRTSFFDTYGVDKEQREQLLLNSPPPKEEVLKVGHAIWPVIEEGKPPLLAYAKRVLLLDEQERPVDQWAVVSLVKMDRLIQASQSESLTSLFITNKKGEVLVQRDMASLKERPNLSSSPLFKKAIQSPVRLSVSPMSMDGEKWLTAFSQAYHGELLVLAQAKESDVFAVVGALTVRTLLFGSIVLTLVILAAFLISRRLTENISLLAERMSAVSQGDLSSSLKLKGSDETVLLAETFNSMIIDLKNSRDELETMNRDLDKKVKERTQELEVQNRKVVEAQEALIRTTRLASMGEVAGRAAHEVLNPLTSLLTRASLADKKITNDHCEPLGLMTEITTAWREDYNQGGFKQLCENWQASSSVDPEKNLFEEDLGNMNSINTSLKEQGESLRKDIQFIRNEGSRIGKIIESMRRLGHMPTHSQRFSIHDLLKDCMDIMADLFSQQAIDMRHEFSAVIDAVLIDRDEFIQATTNLMRNSLQSLKQKGNQSPYFKITTLNESDNLIIEFEDNGIGIPDKDQSRLFQGQFTTKPPEEGTGVGLSISRRFIRNHHGDLDLIHSKSYESTLFRIQLPLHKKQKAAA